MEFDDEEVPSLIDINNAALEARFVDDPTAQLQDISLSKVPLTLITGMSNIWVS